MYKNRFLFMLGIISLVLVSLAISSFRGSASLSNRAAANDYYQRHPNWTWSAPASAGVYSDYFQRHPELNGLSSLGQGASDYVQRHPELSDIANLGQGASDYFERHPELSKLAAPEQDTSDYFLRHPELSVAAATVSIDLTDYYFRHLSK